MTEREPEVPKDIESLVSQTFFIPRFTRIYHEGIFDDNTGAHTVRCVRIAINLELPENERSKLVRMLWIHDLSEIVTSDYSIIQKNSSSALADDLKTKEELAAKMLLNLDDQLLFKEFNNGLTPIAMVAKTIDRIEGNIFFHKELARWVQSDEYSPLHMPSDDSLRYSYEYYQKSVRALSLITNSDFSYREIIRALLDFQLESIRNVWDAVPNERVPKPINEGFDSQQV